MIARQAFRNLLASKLRLFLTSLAIVLGVGFVVGSFVLGDTMNKAFDNVFTTANEGVAVKVRGVETVSEADRQPVPAAVVATVRAVEGVRVAEGAVEGHAQIIGADGKPAGVQGPPALGFGWSDDRDLNPLRVVAGTAPIAPSDVVIDKKTAADEKFAIGDQVRIITASGSAEYRLAGTVAFGDEDASLGGATLAAFPMATAQRAFDSVDRFAGIGVTAMPDVSHATLAARVQVVLPSGYEAITGETSAQESSDQFKVFIDLFRNFLLAFAAIALFVGSFIIFNAFKITVAQRTRQLGLIRAVGASPSQVVRSVLLEAAFIGVAASLIGIAFGIGFAWLLRAGFNAAGASMPPTTLQVAPRSLIVGLAVGVIVTFVAALVPAWRASRVPPMAAMRDVRVAGSPRARLLVSIASTGLGISLVLLGALAPLSGLSQRFGLIGLGALILFLGAAMLTQYVARPLAQLIGAPMSRTSLAGRLGQENAMRNPRRTAQTAAALTIGVALVTGVTVFGASLRATWVDAIDDRLKTDLVIQASGQQGFSPAAATELANAPQLAGVTTLRFDGTFKDARQDKLLMSAVDPATLGRFYDPDVVAGSIAALAQSDTIAIDEAYAKENDLSVGSPMSVLFARTGQTALRVGAVFRDTTFGRFLVSRRQYERDFTTQQDQFIFALAGNGVSTDAAKSIAEGELAAFPNLEVRTKAEYKDYVSGQVNRFLMLFYVLLAMAVIIAVFGIVLTLALSVFERTREIGLLRAVGLSRHSVRAMIRWEAIIVALIGALVGIVLGAFLGVVSVSAIPEFEALAIPWGSMAVFLIVAGIFGVLAAILPARRAARLNVLTAIQAE